MAIDIGELRGLITLQDQFSGPLDKVAKALGLSSESMKAVAGAAGFMASAVAAGAGAIVYLGQRGAVVNDVKDSFASLSERVGSTADAMLDELTKGTQGTITNFDLMQAANSALGSGLIKSAQDMGTLAAGSKFLADRVGGDTAEAFDTLTTAMAKGKTGALKQYGIFVDQTKAVEDYARSLNKNVGDLSQHERATALSQAALTALKKEMEAAGPATLDFGDLIDRAKVGVGNFVDNLSSAIAASPVVMTGLKGIEDALGAAFGGTQEDQIKQIMGYVNQFAIFLVDAGSVAVSTAQFITDAFYNTRAFLNAFLEGLAGGIATVSGWLLTLAEKGQSVPGTIGEGFKDMIGPLQVVVDTSKSMAIGFGEVAGGALAAKDKLDQSFDGVQETIGGIRQSMVDAGKAAVNLGESSDKGGKGVKDLGDAAELSAAQIKAIEDATRKGQEAMFDMKEQGLQKMQELQDGLTQANLTGTEARLFEIQQAQQKEMEGIQGLAFAYPAIYEQLTELITAKYQQMSAAAQGYYTSAAAYAAASGFQTRDQMQQTVDSALAGYNQMKDSGEFTAGELKKAWEKYIKAKDTLEGTSTLSTLEKFNIIANAASSLLRSVFGKSKTAAIAAAIIDTSAAVVKTLAAYPWPWSLAPAAAALAAGIAEINKIRSTDAGFAMGTPDTKFVDFGEGSLRMLHHEEAVVTKVQSESVAGMVEDALTSRDNLTADAIERLSAEMSADRDRLPFLLQSLILLAKPS